MWRPQWRLWKRYLLLLENRRSKNKCSTNKHREKHGCTLSLDLWDTRGTVCVRGRWSASKCHGPVHLSFQSCSSSGDSFIPSLLQLYRPVSHEVCSLWGTAAVTIAVRGQPVTESLTSRSRCIHPYSCVRVGWRKTLKYYLLLCCGILLTVHCSPLCNFKTVFTLITRRRRATCFNFCLEMSSSFKETGGSPVPVKVK